MKHTKSDCSAHHQIIANRCGLACANCGACKCGDVEVEKAYNERERKALESELMK